MLNPLRCKNCGRGFSIMTWEAKDGVWVCPDCETKHRIILEIVSNE